jgi:cell volume regulation protein A
LQGTSIPFVARRLGLEAPLSRKRAYPLEYVSSGFTKNDMVEIPVPENSPFHGRQVLDLGLPKAALIVLLSRNEDFIVPRGNTEIQAGDVLLILAEGPDIDAVRKLAAPDHPTPQAPPSTEVPN